MKPHLKVGSYFIVLHNSSGALGSYNHTDAGGCASRPHIEVSFKIIKYIMK
jgi:hypothetical protein